MKTLRAEMDALTSGASEIRSTALLRGQSVKRANALTAVLSGALPGVLLALYVQPRTTHLLLGLTIGLLWANGFEYIYHRYLLHWPASTLGKGHLLHHATVGRPEEPQHVTFGSSPLWVAFLFLANGLLVLFTGAIWRIGIMPGVLVGFTVYFISVEEIHWRIHLGGWLPPGLRRGREYHLAHHDTPDARFNVFLPIFDLLLGNLTRHTSSSSLAFGDTNDGESNRIWELKLSRIFEKMAFYVFMLVLVIAFRWWWSAMGTRSKSSFS